MTGTGSVQSTLTFASGTTYTPPGSYAVKASAQPKHGSFGIAAAAITPFAALLLFGAATRRRFLAMLPLVLLGVAVFAGIAGCGGSSGTSGVNPVPTPTGTSQVTVTATSGSISQNTTITLTVQ